MDEVQKTTILSAPTKTPMIEELRELWRYRELLFSMVRRELSIRYKNSLFGFLWSLLNPLLTVLVMTFVFKVIMGNPIPNYSAYVLAAYLPFTFFQLALMDSSSCVLNTLPLIRKIYFPREILPLSLVISNFVHLVLALLVFFVYLLVLWALNPQVAPFQASAVLLPILLIINFMLVCGLSFMLAAWTVFYEDLKYITSIILYLLFFLAPVMYFQEEAREKLSHFGKIGHIGYLLYSSNPISALCTAYRKILLAPQKVFLGGEHGHYVEALPLNWKLIGISALLSVFLMFYGYHAFNQLKWKFVERP